MKIGIPKGLKDFWGKLKTKDKLILLSAVGGLTVIAFTFFPTTPTKSVPPAQSALSADDYRKYLESRLTSSLTSVEGVGKVEILVTLEGEAPKSVTYETDTTTSVTTDPSGKQSQNTVEKQSAIYSKDQSGQSPYLSGESYPKVVGVVVIAEGGADSMTKYYITEAIKATLDVPAHKIVVLPMKKK